MNGVYFSAEDDKVGQDMQGTGERLDWACTRLVSPCGCLCYRWRVKSRVHFALIWMMGRAPTNSMYASGIGSVAATYSSRQFLVRPQT